MSDESSKLERLNFWEEIIGTYLGSYATERFTYVKIGKKMLAFENESKAAEITRIKLKPEFIDQTVGILRTDYHEQPLVIRIVKKYVTNRTGV